MNKEIDNNFVELVGEISKEAEYSHEIYGERFYIISMKVQRTSGNEDEIPVMVSGRMCNPKEFYTGQRLKVSGQCRSYNRHEETANRLILYVFVQEMEFLDEMQDDLQVNDIYLDGYICKEPTYRETPLGREISDLLIAVNRPYGKSDYIPCICWGRNAHYAYKLEAGSHVRISGRIQSRTYLKRISDTEKEERIAYEVSAGKINVVEEN